jgi:UV DNA damage repair endonuclease
LVGAGVIIIHAGGLYMTKKPIKPTGKSVTNNEKMQEYNLKLYNCRREAKKVTKQRWIEQFYRLPINVQRRLAIENDEDDFNITDCLEIAQACKIPVVVDFFHYQCFQERHSAQECDPAIVHNSSSKSHLAITPEFQQLFASVLQTWQNTRPLFHISERITGVKPTDKNACAHSDYITKIPDFILELFRLYCPLGVDLEVEAKAKEVAIVQLWKAQPFLYSHV